MDDFFDKQEINVVFLGGSITEGAHASINENCYASLTSAWLKETFGQNGRIVNCYNKGVGGTPSQYGLLRLSRDVIANNPDLVFIEFAVNDGGEDTRVYMESIVRSLQETVDPYIIFLYTTNEVYSTETKYHADLAAHYGIPEISLKDALHRELDGKNPRECGYFTDAVHPADAGHAVYFREIVRCLSTGEYFKKAQKREKRIAASGAVDMRFISSAGNEVERIGAWETGGTRPDRPFAKTTTVGDRLRLSFEGSIFAVEHGLHAKSCMYELYIDGQLVETIHPVYADIATYQLVQGYATFHLSPGRHEAEIITVPSTNPKYTGTEVLIYNFIVGNKAT
ncbi:MAG: SGNH/GDSL hydrolase family protein [Clostridia bacterium]|nr:SGNH/GDSL hydrolase family protein [Clostridia bacterium]